MHTHDEVEHILHRLEQVLFVVDVDIKFSLHCIVDQNASLNVKLVVLIVPVGLECDGHAVPAVGVRLAETVAADADHALRQDVGLLLKVDVVLAGVVEGAESERGTVERAHTLNFREALQHFFINLL